MPPVRPRDNPFRSERIDHAPYRLHGATWPDLLARVLAQRGPSSIVGPHGAGKSRLLHELAARLRDRGIPVHHLRLDRQPAPFPTSPGAILLVDGLEAQPLWRRAWWSVRWHRARALVFTRHTRGRDPVLHECRPDFALARALVDTLTADLPHPVPDADLRALLQAHPADLRSLLRALYDRFSTLP